MFPGKEKYFSDRRYLHSHTIPFSDKCNKTVSIKPRVGQTTEPHRRHAANLVFFYWFQPLFSVLCFNINMFSTFSTLFELAMDSLRRDVCILYLHRTLLFLYVSWCAGWNDVIKHSAPGPRESGWYGASWFVKWIKGKLYAITLIKTDGHFKTWKSVNNIPR